MRKYRYKKRFRQIELILKLGVVIGIVTFVIIGKSDSLHTPATLPSTSTSAVTHIISMKGLSQDGIPTGCESVSTVALLQHLCIEISIDEFIESFLPCKSFYRVGGVVYGPDPNEYFAGNPYEKAALDVTQM